MATLGHNGLKNRTFSIFQTASSQGFPVNLPWLKYISMAKTSYKNANVNQPVRRRASGNAAAASLHTFLGKPISWGPFIRIRVDPMAHNQNGRLRIERKSGLYVTYVFYG